MAMATDQRIQFLKGPLAGKTFKVLGDSIRIGRGKDNDIIIDDRNLSRNHAELRRTAEGVLLRDLGSTNGLYVEDRRVGEILLGEGVVVRFGDSLLTLKPSGATQASRVTGLNQAANLGTIGLSTQTKPKVSLPKLSLGGANAKRVVMYGGLGVLLLYALLRSEDPPPDAGTVPAGAAVPGGMEAAEIDYEPLELIRITKEEEEPTFRRALHLHDVGKLNQALDLIESLIRLDPGNSLYKIKKVEWVRTRQDHAMEVFRQGMLHFDTKLYTAALVDFKRVLQILPEDRNPLHLQAKMRIAQIEQAMRR
ncbi:MAG: hypothetical protein A2284_16295 [Deltaproteobacteria bacterium RIFOXYA12_FULL_61_11]|nr:MAG: hypothetical protein A2284_16295 [Deltaproteobacteria bacterium RIFOXYA12_FULL_61_11]